MRAPAQRRCGFTCAYTPLPLLDAAGLLPVRLRPDGDAPEEAATLLHDNLCPHVKRVLDRRLAGDLDDLAGLVVMGSCDAMRRLVDAWRVAAPRDRVTLVDLPVGQDEGSVAYLAGELRLLAETLSAWTDSAVEPALVEERAARRDEVVAALSRLERRHGEGALRGGAARLQELRNRAVAEPPEDLLAELVAEAEAPGSPASPAGVPVFVHGNVLPAPEAMALFESCGARVVGDDLCTGSRQSAAPALRGDGDLWTRLARGVLLRPRCARTITAAGRGDLAGEVTRAALESGARGVIAHVAKFCDPYLARLPALREALREAGLPLLVLDGDCTLRSLGQGRTRIEAFVEMLG